MDTLLEANRHASLMRRRDHLRQFPAAQLQCNPAIAPRAFGIATTVAGRPVLRAVPSRALLPTVRIDAVSQELFAPETGGGPAGKKSLAARALSVPVVQRRAAVAQFRLALEPGEGCGRLSATKGRELSMTAKVGNAFRVSGGAGFRVPSIKVLHAKFPRPAVLGMKWPEGLPLPFAAYIGSAIGKQAAGPAPISATGVAIPVSKRAPATGVPAIRALPLRVPAPRPAHAESRPAEWTWPKESRQLMPTSGLRAGQASVGPGPVRLKLIPAAATAEPRLERAPFQPPDQAWLSLSYSWSGTR